MKLMKENLYTSNIVEIKIKIKIYRLSMNKFQKFQLGNSVLK